jgi:hypothetical protein
MPDICLNHRNAAKALNTLFKLNKKFKKRQPDLQAKVNRRLFENIGIIPVCSD